MSSIGLSKHLRCNVSGCTKQRPYWSQCCKQHREQRSEPELHLFHIVSPHGALLTTMRAADNKDAAFKTLEWMKAHDRKRVHIRRIVEH